MSGPKTGNDHQWCGDAIVTLIAEVNRLRALVAESHNVKVGAIALSPQASALIETAWVDRVESAGHERCLDCGRSDGGCDRLATPTTSPEEVR